MTGRSILIVDDDTYYRDNVANELAKECELVEGVSSGEEAIEMLTRDPNRYQYAVIDQDLGGSGIDGIETTKELLKFNNALFILIFTNVPTDDREKAARYKYEAMAAGAYRYLAQKTASEAKRQISDFLAEIEQLERLRTWISDYYENRANVPSLITQLDIGVDIIDRAYKVWFMNDAMQRIIGIEAGRVPDEMTAAWPSISSVLSSAGHATVGNGYETSPPKGPCSAWHGHRVTPCPGCIVARSFTYSGSYDRYFLSPLPYRNPDSLHYLRVWSQPVKDESGNILICPDQKPLAVMESVQDLTNTPQLREMSIDQRLDIISNSLFERPQDDCYILKRCFDKVRIYIKSTADNTFLLMTAAGFNPAPNMPAPVDLYATQYLQAAEHQMRDSGIGMFFSEPGAVDPITPGESRECFIYWPIIREDQTVAVLEVSGERCDTGLVPVLEPYAQEILAAVDDADTAPDTASADFTKALAEIDLKLQTVTSPEDALRLLASRCCELTESDLASLRYREDDECVLLRLGLGKYGEYENQAVVRYPLTYVASWSARTVLSGQEQLADTNSNADTIEQFRSYLAPNAQRVLEPMNSLCFEPLLLDGRCVGAFGLMAKRVDNFADRRKLLVARSIAGRMALALHDYLVDQKAREQVVKAQNETLQTLLHNINSPLGTLNSKLHRVTEMLTEKGATSDIITIIETAQEQAEKIGNIRNKYLKLQENWESRIEEIDLHQLLIEIIHDSSKECQDIIFKHELHPYLQYVSTDATAIRVCLDVLLENAVDILTTVSSEKNVLIRLRPIQQEEMVYVTSSSTALTIDVIDSGPGVPSNIADQLFRVIHSTKAKGHGLGLTYCKHVATSARGDVYCNRQLQNGAEFRLVLPYMKSN